MVVESTNSVPLSSVTQHSYPSAQVIDEYRLARDQRDFHLVSHAGHAGRPAARFGIGKRRCYPINQLSQSPQFLMPNLSPNAVAPRRRASNEGTILLDSETIAAATIFIPHCLAVRLLPYREPTVRGATQSGRCAG
jgi:hypothetical protein